MRRYISGHSDEPHYYILQAEEGIRDSSETGVQTCDFFFQAEDGIRDSSVTGVQTCALPISTCAGQIANLKNDGSLEVSVRERIENDVIDDAEHHGGRADTKRKSENGDQREEIGRASCRERV